MQGAISLLSEYDQSRVREGDMGRRKPKRPQRAGKSTHNRREKPLVSALAEPEPITTASIAPASVEPEPVSHAIGEERDSFSLGQEASGGFLLPPAYQDLEPIQVEDDGLPGVEYDLVLTAPPNGSIKCLGVVTTISEGRNDLPITDSDWAGIVFGDDET